MKVLKNQVLVKPVVNKSVLLTNIRAEKGDVVAAGSDCELKIGDNLIFGEEFEELNLTVDGQPISYLLMHETNVKVYFSKDK